MICFRVVVVLLLALFTACMTCSCLFPLFRHTSESPYSFAVDMILNYYYFYAETRAQNPDKTWTIHRMYTRDSTCEKGRVAFVAASWLAVAAAGLGGLATLLSAAWICVGRSICLGVTNFMLTLLAFLCAAAVVALMACGYRIDTMCAAVSADGSTSSLFDLGFSIAEGFVLLSVAAVGFLVVMITEAVGFCCGCQVGRRPAQRMFDEESHEPIEHGTKPVERQRAPVPPAPKKVAPRKEVVVVAEKANDSAEVSTQPRPYRVCEAVSEQDDEGSYPYPAKHTS